MSSSSSADTVNSATQQNNVIPAVVMQDRLIDIEDAQVEPEFIFLVHHSYPHTRYTLHQHPKIAQGLLALLQQHQGCRYKNQIRRLLQTYRQIIVQIMTIIPLVHYRLPRIVSHVLHTPYTQLYLQQLRLWTIRTSI